MSMTARDDERPPVWVGHVVLAVADIQKSCDFWKRVGMRLIESGESVAIFELRGGTHLVLLPSQTPIAEGSPATFDVMVEDVDEAWKSYTEQGLRPTEIDRGRIHDSFHVPEPSGYRVTVNSSHVEGVV